ncbi:MAG: methionine biosynthesis protein MetW [Anaerolineae bacterium]
MAENTLRTDLLVVAELVPERSRVLDLGCGDGTLLRYLIDHKHVQGRGVELSEAGVRACVARGLSVVQGDLDDGLADYPDDTFDVVILSQTLPYLDDPLLILKEMLRVGRQGIVSFPNWGYWQCRLSFLLTGRIPKAPALPQPWYAPPRVRPLTVRDFGDLCRDAGIRVTHQVYLNDWGRVSPWRKWKNLLSTVAIMVIEK